MAAKDEIHSGHRERLMSKFVAYPDSLSDHELLELMLFSFIPRVNTNGIAHLLLDRFGSIEKVFACTPTELITVEGVGKKTAAAISLCGKIYGKIFEKRLTAPPKSWRYFIDYSKTIQPDFKNLTDEKLIIYFLDQNYLLFYKLSFTDKSSSSVKVDFSELSSKIALKKPRYLIVAHNHPSNITTPSFDDDLTVKKLMLLCVTNGCSLVDSLIYAERNIYSYLIARRFETNQELADLYFNFKFLEGANQC